MKAYSKSWILMSILISAMLLVISIASQTARAVDIRYATRRSEGSRTAAANALNTNTSGIIYVDTDRPAVQENNGTFKAGATCFPTWDLLTSTRLLPG
jgi:hypothetical protein